jgi:hypothetical protein
MQTASPLLYIASNGVVRNLLREDMFTLFPTTTDDEHLSVIAGVYS